MFYQSQPELNIFAIFLRLGLFTRSYRWNAFKDNKEIRIAFRNPYQGEREAFKVNKAVQLSTISHFPLPVSQLWIWLMLNFLDVHIKIFWCIHKDSFSFLFFFSPSSAMRAEYGQENKTIPNDYNLEKHPLQKGSGLHTCWSLLFKWKLKLRIIMSLEQELKHLIIPFGHPIKVVCGRTLFPSCHPLSCCQRIWRAPGVTLDLKMTMSHCQCPFSCTLNYIITSRQSGFL